MLTYLLQKLQPRPTESGFTIIESLLAVLLIAIVLVGIGPIIAFSTATRIQSRRVEIGIQAARGYLSGVQSGTIPHPPIAYTTNNPVALALGEVNPPPTNTLTCPTGNAYCTNPVNNSQYALYCVDLDGGGCSANSPRDLVIQAFGLQVQPTSGTRAETFPLNADGKNPSLDRPNAGYQLGIRVYRANSFGQNPLVTLQKSSQPPNNQRPNRASTLTSGTGSRSLPIVEMTTEVSISGVGGTNFSDLCQRINRTAKTGRTIGNCNN